MAEVEETPRRSLKRKAYYTMKMKRAAHLLFFKRHSRPGAKGWELKKSIGPEYHKVLDLLDQYLEKLDLRVKMVFEEGEGSIGRSAPQQPDKARFYITLRGTLTPSEAKLVGWRIDDLAALTITIAYIISKRGKAPRKDVEALLKSKLPGWRVDMNLDRFIRYGYIGEDENGQLYLDWRTRAEVDERELINLLLGVEMKPSKIKGEAESLSGGDEEE